MNRENKKKEFEKGITKPMPARRFLLARSAEERLFPRAQEATIATIAQTAFAVFMWILSPATGNPIAAELWTPLPFGCAKTANGQ